MRRMAQNGSERGEAGVDGVDPGWLERRLREEAVLARREAPAYLRQRVMATVETTPIEPVGFRWSWTALGMAACCAGLVAANFMLRPPLPGRPVSSAAITAMPWTSLPDGLAFHPAAALRVSVEAPMLREGELLAGDVRRAADAVLSALPFGRLD
jgi:hypothetical protein